MNSRNSSSSRVVQLVARFELPLLALTAPLMLFPNRLVFLAPLFIALLWLARFYTYGYWTRTSVMSPPIVILAVMAIVGYMVSIDQALSAPKLWGILFQAAVFFGALNGLHSKRDFNYLADALVLMTLGLALVSLLGTNWQVVRLVDLNGIYDRIPTLVQSIPDSGLSPGQELFHPRQVGATMGMLLPFVTVLVFIATSRFSRAISILTLLIGLGVLLLSQSLMGIFGLLVGWLILLIWWRRWVLVVPILVFIALLLLLWRINLIAYVPSLLSYEDNFGVAIVLRLDMWSRALAMLNDMPYTGIGLNTFPLVQSHFYTGYAIGPEPHAHNLLLQTAVDLGLPGLLALIWLVIAFGATVIIGTRIIADQFLRWLLIGLAASIFSFLAGGVLDVMTLGAKPVFMLFLMLGMAGAITWHEIGTSPIGGESRSLLVQQRLASGMALFTYIGLLGVAAVLKPEIPTTNFALISAQKAIYQSRRDSYLSESAAQAAVTQVIKAMALDSDNSELLGALGSLYAWQEQPAEAVEAFSARVTVDSINPFTQYAPFLKYQRQLQGLESLVPDKELPLVYQQWQRRFPERAEGYLLLAIAEANFAGDFVRARDVLEAGIDGSASPVSSLVYYHTLVAEETSK